MARNIIRLTGVLLSVVLTISPATNAQDDQVRKKKSSREVLMEEVVVTARKRSVVENIQEVPIAVTAYTGDMLEALAIENASDLRHTTPNSLLLPQSTAPSMAAFRIRGSGTGSSIPSDDPGVGIIQDGMVLGVSTGANLAMFDMDSVEVLRGPQGTLFGRNTSAGLVNTKTKRPSFEAEGRLTLGAGSGDSVKVGGRYTGTIVEDRVAGKLTLLYSDEDGYWENKTLGSNHGQHTDILIRPYFRYTPTSDLTIDVLLEFGDISSDDGNVPYVNDGTLFKSPPYYTETRDTDEVFWGITGFNDIEWNHVIIDATYDTANGVIAWNTAFRTIEQHWEIDADGDDLGIFQGEFHLDDQDQFSQEIRYSGTPFKNKNVNLTVGFFYFDQEYKYREKRTINSDLQFAPVEFFQALGGDVQHDTWAVFGRVGYSITDRWKLDVGLRYTDETKDAQIAPSSCDTTTLECTFTFEDDNDWSDVTPYFGLQWIVSEDTQAYASYSKGFRSGGYNVRVSNPRNSPGPYDEEETTAVEIGIKTDLLQDRLRVNLALFENQFTDLQRTVVNPDASQTVRNAADATIRGMEIELWASMSDNFTLNANYGWLDGEYDEFDGFAGFNFPPGIDPSNAKLEGVADNSYSVTGIYDWRLANAGVLTLRAAYSYRDERTNAQNTLTFEPNKYLDASVTYSPLNGQWRASVFGRNLKDEGNTIGGSKTSLFTVLTPLKGREWGLTLDYYF